jgi:hypothetical protein
MNIFYLDKDPKLAAQYHCDKHIVKMILESAQLLSTAWHELRPGKAALMDIYKSTHKNHPSAVWVRKDARHYRWLANLMTELCKEYTLRYGRIHASERLLKQLAKEPNTESNFRFIPPPQCMPEQYQCADTIQAYRNYYTFGKTYLLKYTNRNRPHWLQTCESEAA